MSDKEQSWTDEDAQAWLETVSEEEYELTLIKFALNGDSEATAVLWQEIASGRITGGIIKHYLPAIGLAITRNLDEDIYPAADLAMGLNRPAHRPKGEKPKLLDHLFMAVYIEILRMDSTLDAACLEAATNMDFKTKAKDKIAAAKDIYKRHKTAVKHAISVYDGEILDAERTNVHEIVWLAAEAMGTSPGKIQHDHIRSTRLKNSKGG